MILLSSNIQVQVVLQGKTVRLSADTNGEVEECAVKHHTDLVSLMFSRSLPNWVEYITVKQMGISKLKNLTVRISVTVEMDVKLKTRKVNVRKETKPSRGHTGSFLTHKFIYNTGPVSKPLSLPRSKNENKVAISYRW